MTSFEALVKEFDEKKREVIVMDDFHRLVVPVDWAKSFLSYVYEAGKQEAYEECYDVVQNRLPDSMTEKEKEEFHCESSVLFWGERILSSIKALKERK